MKKGDCEHGQKDVGENILGFDKKKKKKEKLKSVFYIKRQLEKIVKEHERIPKALLKGRKNLIWRKE